MSRTTTNRSSSLPLILPTVCGTSLNLYPCFRAPITSTCFIMFLFRALALLCGCVVSLISTSFCLFHFLFYFYLCFYLFSFFVSFISFLFFPSFSFFFGLWSGLFGCVLVPGTLAPNLLYLDELRLTAVRFILFHKKFVTT